MHANVSSASGNAPASSPHSTHVSRTRKVGAEQPQQVRQLGGGERLV